MRADDESGDSSVSFDVEGCVGQPVALPISDGPATGYAWELELPSGLSRIANGPERVVKESDRHGGSLACAIRIAAPIGRHTVTARLVRPWKPTNAVRVVVTTINVKAVPNDS